MASSTGLAGLAVTTLVAALVALGVAMLAGPAAAPAPPAAPGRDPSADLRREVERLGREVEEVRRAGPAASPASAAGGAAGGKPAPSPAAGTAAPGTTGADADTEGPLPATRAELVALMDRRIALKAAQGVAAGGAAAQRKRVTIEEAGAEMGLSSVEIDTARRIWRESENEMLTSVMGTPDLEAIKEELKAAAEDPGRKADLINKAVGNMFRNLGRIMTIEDRRDRELKKYLGEEQTKKLKGYDVKSTLEDPEMEDVLQKVLGGK